LNGAIGQRFYDDITIDALSNAVIWARNYNHSKEVSSQDSRYVKSVSSPTVR
jgi:hypothetical protein